MMKNNGIDHFFLKLSTFVSYICCPLYHLLFLTYYTLLGYSCTGHGSSFAKDLPRGCAHHFYSATSARSVGNAIVIKSAVQPSS